MRWAEAIEQLTKHLSSHGLQDVTIHNVDYTDLINDLTIQKSVQHATANLANRGFDILLTGTNRITNEEIVTNFRAPTREWSPWAGGLGFINTYAHPNNREQTLNPLYEKKSG